MGRDVRLTYIFGGNCDLLEGALLWWFKNKLREKYVHSKTKVAATYKKILEPF